MKVLNKAFPCRLSSNGCSGPNIICGGDLGCRFKNILTLKKSVALVFLYSLPFNLSGQSQASSRMGREGRIWQPCSTPSYSKVRIPMMNWWWWWWRRRWWRWWWRGWGGGWWWEPSQLFQGEPDFLWLYFDESLSCPSYQGANSSKACRSQFKGSELFRTELEHPAGGRREAGGGQAEDQGTTTHQTGWISVFTQIFHLLDFEFQ